MTNHPIQPLYPPAAEAVPLRGLYLRNHILDHGSADTPFVYSNYITSLDGRIAMEHPETGKYGPPTSITNARDWRLFQELAAQADVIIVSGRYLRELKAGTAQANLPVNSGEAFEDLLAWRKENHLTPQPAIAVISASLDLPFAEIFADSDRQGIVITGEAADPEKIALIEAAGGQVIKTNPGARVEGKAMIQALGKAGFHRIYAVAGPVLLETLLRDQVLDRLYLTHAQHVLGGKTYDTIFEGHALNPPAEFSLHSLYYDDAGHHDADAPGQLFGCYNRRHSPAKPDAEAP